MNIEHYGLYDLANVIACEPKKYWKLYALILAEVSTAIEGAFAKSFPFDVARRNSYQMSVLLTCAKAIDQPDHRDAERTLQILRRLTYDVHGGDHLNQGVARLLDELVKASAPFPEYMSIDVDVVADAD